MAGCDELESTILDRAAGALPPGEAQALQAHLDGCPRCRAWLASCEEAIQLAALPEPSEAELRLFSHLPGRARAAFRERAQRSAWGRPWVAALLGAAAVAALVMVARPRWEARRGAGAASPAVAGRQAQEPSELEAWALSDPLEDQDEQLLAGAAGEAVDDASVEPEDVTDLDLDTETTETTE